LIIWILLLNDADYCVAGQLDINMND